MIGGVKYRMFLVIAVAIFVACSHEKTPQVTIEQQIRQYTQPWIGVQLTGPYHRPGCGRPSPLRMAWQRGVCHHTTYEALSEDR